MLLTFIHAVVFGVALAGGLPANLECRDLDKGAESLGAFHIYNMDKGESDFWLDRDARGETMTVGRRITLMIASNGCDNYYEFKFSTRGLRRLAQGKLKKLRASLFYYNAEYYTEERGHRDIKTTIECWIDPVGPESQALL